MIWKNSDTACLSKIRPDLLICLFLVTAILWVYWPVRSYEFVAYDDPGYVSDNHTVKKGLTRDTIIWALKSTTFSNWHPLTWLSHMLDIQLYGMSAGHHHLTNVLFHIANSLLVLFVFRRMTGGLWQSGLIAALFALHPLHVESVAWVAERKDVLSTFFWMLTMWCYVRYAEQPSPQRYFFVIIVFALGLMSKPMLVTLPFVLLLIDYWPLRRFQFGNTGFLQQRLPLSRLFMEKTPLFILASASSVVTLLVQKKGGAVGSWEIYPFSIRVANALVSYVHYIIKMIWPFQLAVFYPHPGSLPFWQISGACLLLMLLSFLAIKMLKQRPWFAVGWFWFMGTLLPVIGLVQVGLQAMADRYTYVPLVGLFVIIAWGGAELAANRRSKAKGLAAMWAALLVFFIITSLQQVRYWKNSFTLYEHALEVTTNNYLIHNNLGFVLNAQGRPIDAIKHYQAALRINPDFEPAYVGIGLAMMSQGKLDECIDYYRKVLQVKPRYAKVHNNLGVALFRKGEIDAAVGHFREAIRFKAAYVGAYNNLGTAILKQGKFDEAIGLFQEALRLQPDYYQAQTNLKDAQNAKIKNLSAKKQPGNKLKYEF